MESFGFILWLIGLSLITFFAVAWLLDLNSRQRQLQKRLEQALSDASAWATTSQHPLTSAESWQQMQNDLAQLKTRLPFNIQAVGLVRFQAFKDYGGDQSFALALANAAGDGIVISSLYARDGTRVYAKSLKAWISSYSLSFEEEEAIKQAQSQIQAQT